MARQADTDERDSVHGVNPGTELGRYTVNARIDTIPGGERWSARDTTLERDVTLLVMPADQPSTDAALDAARRAAGVEAAQLVRILDVGTEGDHSYIAEEGVGDSDTFAEAIDTEGLPAEEVRRITGEVATGIEAARARGLHHLALTPDAVLLTHDGRVKVRGLATSAALAGIETEGEDADRDDATGVVALAYAGLTATWPLSGDTSLPAAPRDGGSVPPPSRVAVGVPGDLDTICRETLNEEAGPDSPGDYAAQIAPWSRIPLTSAARPAPSGTADSSTGSPAPAKGAAAAGAAGAATAAGATGGTAARSTGGSQAGSVQPDDENVTREINLHPEDEPTRTIDTRQVGRQDRTGAEAEDARQGDSQSRAKAAAAAAAAAGAVGTGAKVLGGHLGKASKTANARSKEAYQDARARREAIREDRARRTSLGAAPISAELEPPAPLLPAEAGAPPSRSQSNLVMVLMAALVSLACVGGIFGSAQIGANTDLGKIFGAEETTAAQTRTPDSQTPTSSGESSSDDENEPYQILNAAGFDPEPGDGSEHNAEVQRVYDGDDDTAWTTEGYFDPEFGGAKDGVGITVDLGQAQKINAVTLDLPTTANATVYAGDEPTRSGTEIGSTEGEDGEVTLETDDPTEAQYVTVWFTSLTQSEEDGRYRAALSEITVR